MLYNQWLNDNKVIILPGTEAISSIQPSSQPMSDDESTTELGPTGVTHFSGICTPQPQSSSSPSPAGQQNLDEKMNNEDVSIEVQRCMQSSESPPVSTCKPTTPVNVDSHISDQEENSEAADSTEAWRGRTPSPMTWEQSSRVGTPMPASPLPFSPMRFSPITETAPSISNRDECCTNLMDVMGATSPIRTPMPYSPPPFSPMRLSHVSQRAPSISDGDECCTDPRDLIGIYKKYAQSPVLSAALQQSREGTPMPTSPGGFSPLKLSPTTVTVDQHTSNEEENMDADDYIRTWREQSPFQWETLSLGDDSPMPLSPTCIQFSPMPFSPLTEDAARDSKAHNLSFKLSRPSSKVDTPEPLVSTPADIKQSTGKATTSSKTKTSPVFSTTKIKRDKIARCVTGSSRDILKELNFNLPKTPPIRGNVRMRKVNKKNKDAPKENVFQARERVVKRREKKKETAGKKVTPTESIQLSANEMLTDVHINAAQNVLVKQFPKVPGLEDTVLGSKLQFNMHSGDFVQILHDGGLHWICVSNLFCEDNSVEVFDSMYASLPVHVKMQVACIMMVQQAALTVKVVNFQRQSGGSDCGLFAIAAATELCHGNDPSKKVFYQDQMRDHLLACLKNDQLTPFPSASKERNVRKRISKVLVVPVYCICRLPDNTEEKMVECDTCNEWFHKSCMSIPSSVFEGKDSWVCNGCKQ